MRYYFILLALVPSLLFADSWQKYLDTLQEETYALMMEYPAPQNRDASKEAWIAACQQIDIISNLVFLTEEGRDIKKHEIYTRRSSLINGITTPEPANTNQKMVDATQQLTYIFDLYHYGLSEYMAGNIQNNMWVNIKRNSTDLKKYWCTLIDE